MTTRIRKSGGGCATEPDLYAFQTITPTSGDPVVADQFADTLTLTAGSGISITGTAASDTITIANTGIITPSTWAAVLAAGNTSGGTSPVVSSGDTLTLTDISNTRVLYSNSGVVSGDARVTWNPTSGLFKVYGLVDGGTNIIFEVAADGGGTPVLRVYDTTYIYSYANLLFSADNTYDIGAASATRPRNLYLAAHTAGGVFYAASNGLVSTDNSGLFFDAANNRLGIGLASPGYNLEVRAAATDRVISYIDQTTNPYSSTTSPAIGLIVVSSNTGVGDNFSDFSGYSIFNTLAFAKHCTAGDLVATYNSYANYSANNITTSHVGSSTFLIQDFNYGAQIVLNVQGTNTAADAFAYHDAAAVDIDFDFLPTYNNASYVNAAQNVYGERINVNYNPTLTAGTLTDTRVYGHYVTVAHDGTGTSDYAFGYYLSSVTGAANNWGLYILAAAPNYLAYSLGINIAIPTSRLHIVSNDGTLSIDNPVVYVNGGTNPFDKNAASDLVYLDRHIGDSTHQNTHRNIYQELTVNETFNSTISDSNWSRIGNDVLVTNNTTYTTGYDHQSGVESWYSYNGVTDINGSCTTAGHLKNDYYGMNIRVSDDMSFNNASGTYDVNLYGIKIITSQNGTLTAGTLTRTNYGIYIDVGSNLGGTVTTYGLYINDVDGDTEYAIYTNTTAPSVIKGITDFQAGLRTIIVTDNVSSPPTDAELDTAFGQPSTVGAGFVGIVNDNAAGTAEYICWSDGTNWFYAAGTKAV